MYDTRVCRFISVDPLTKKYPELTPFQFASNTPIEAIDLDGLEGVSTNIETKDAGTITYVGWDSEKSEYYTENQLKGFEISATRIGVSDANGNPVASTQNAPEPIKGTVGSAAPADPPGGNWNFNVRISLTAGAGGDYTWLGRHGLNFSFGVK